MASKEELLAKLSECVVEMEDEEVVDVAKEYIEAGYPAFDGIMEGLVDGMNKASELLFISPQALSLSMKSLEECGRVFCNRCTPLL